MNSSEIRIRQIVGIDTDIVRLRIVNKTHSLDVAATLKQRFANTVHSVHDAAV